MTHATAGLSESEVIARRERGQGNAIQFQTSRTYLQILRKNAFTFINSVLFGIGVLLILMGQLGDAVVTAGLVLMNVIVGVYQEGRAKRKLDQIALLTRPRATVLRDGQERSVDPSEIVLGDVLIARPGDQIIVDGEIVGDGQMEVDESLLTGESERIQKRHGEPVYSGSFCVTGSARYEAQHVGADSLINRMTKGARAFRQVKTPLQRDIDFIVRILVLLSTQLGILLALSFLIQGLPLVETVRMAAVVVALVPQGLFFMTTNRIQLHEIHPVGKPLDGGEVALRGVLGTYAASGTGGSRTSDAILAACGGEPCAIRMEIPFSSERKWSAVAFDDRNLQGVYVLGAPEVLRPNLSAYDGDLDGRVDAWTGQGMRVILFAHHPEMPKLVNSEGQPQMPRALLPLALLSFTDELRPEAQETLRHFGELGIEPKIISGDHPRTVAALARQVGFAEDVQAISGLDMQNADDEQIDQLAAETTVFGRITPQQKERLVQCFREQGHYVAMIGDGVNDVLSLKQAQIGIAMQSGSQATRGVADIVLLGDSFEALPIAFREGQRIVRGMEDVVRLLLTRTFYVLFLIVATQLVGIAFPVTPKHNSILALLTVGIPILAIAAWARPGAPPRSVVRSTSHFVFPAAFTISIVALAVYLGYLTTTNDAALARTALTTATIMCGLLLIPFVEPPTQWWVGGDLWSGDWRPSLLALAMLALYGVIVAVPPLREFFELTLLRWWDYLLIAAVAAGWALVLRVVWRTRVFEKVFSLDGR